MTEDMVDFAPFELNPRHSISFNDGYFLFAEPVPSRAEARSSSGKKYVYRGTHVRVSGSSSVRTPACAVYFARETGGLDYARERMGLALGGALGVGPRTLEAEARRRLPGAAEEDPLLTLVVEEDVGVSLEDALRGAPVPLFLDGEDRDGVSLPDPATPEGARVAHKILFDVLAQAEALQRQGLYHRDLRSANIALRAWGPGAEGVRATLIDFEFLTDARHGWVRCPGYYDRLFGTGGLVPLGRDPTLLEQDLGYLAVVTAEVLNGRSVGDLSDDAVLAVLRSSRSPLRAGDGGVFARRLMLSDVWAEARLAGVPTAREAYGRISERAVVIAERESAHAGHIDTLDRIRLERSVEMILEQSTTERLVRAMFEVYKEQRRQDGKPLEFETFEEQPEDYRNSCLGQVRSYCDKVRMLGYDLVLAQECDEARRVSSFSDEEVEFLAREEHARWVEERVQAGWVYGSEKDVERKISPYLVPWSELDEGTREYDRAFIRKMIALVESVGLAVVR